MEAELQPRRESLHQVCIAVARKEYRLEKSEADRPDAGGTAEPGHDLLGNNGLNEEKKKARQPNSQRVDQDLPLPWFLGIQALGQGEPNMLLCAR